MIDDSGMYKSLESVKDKKIDVVIESGTFEGNGSTRTVGNFFKKSPPKAFYTIEINYASYVKAKKNLLDLPFVRCLYGCSVPMREALDFIRSDDAILNHQKYPDIFIDDVIDPVKFYSREVEGYLNGGPMGIRRLFKPKPAERLLKKLIGRYKDDTILFILDSAGGMGWLEFITVKKEMGNRDYYLLLDDIHHLKHFRSAKYIRENPSEFEIIKENREHGWLFCYKKRS
jgi:hypothetical protein